MKKLLLVFVIALPFIFVGTASAEPGNCIFIPWLKSWICEDVQTAPTVVPSTPTTVPATPTRTATAVPPATNTPVPPSPAPTSVPPTVPPSPTATATPPANIRQIPQRSTDGTYYITQPGIYTGVASCGAIAAGAHCVHIWNSNGVTLQDFSIISEGGYGLQFDNNTNFKRGPITAPLGASGHQKVNVHFEEVTFSVQSVAFQLLDTGGGCEGLSTKRNRNVTIRQSTFRNQGGTEFLYAKCAQDLFIENNSFFPLSEWAVSTPDGLNINIRGNNFDLTHEVRNWLAIELPRVFGASVVNNRVIGPAPGDWLVYVNSGTRDLTVTDNCLVSGMSGAVHTSHQAGGVPNLVEARNGICSSTTPPTVGDGGLK